MERCLAYARGTYAGLDAVKFPHRSAEQLLIYGTGGEIEGSNGSFGDSAKL